MAENESNPIGEAKEVASEGLRRLGLVELIFGGLLIYILWRTNPGDISSHFPTTSLPWADAALLVAVAAAAGRVVTLAVAVVMAIVGSIGSCWGGRERLTKEIKRLRLGGADLDPSEVVDVADLIVLRQSKAAWDFANNARDSAIVAYSFFIILLLLWLLGGVPQVISWGWEITLVLVCLILGSLNQADYQRKLLWSLRTSPISSGKKNRKEGSHDVAD